MTAVATVAIPVLDGGPLLGEVLEAIRAQELDRELELLVADSGSSDGSRELARRTGARVLDIPRGEFSHGGTRNLLASEAAGDHIAFLTQDALPSDEHWLERLLAGFELSERVGLVFGPYLPRPEASVMVRRELTEWFRDFSPQRVAVLDEAGDPEPRRSFFTDANGAIARAAWQAVPFRSVAYAEDQLLARDMLAAGWAKAYVPAAAVVHSHDYGVAEQLRRSFDEWRGLAEVAAMRAHRRPSDVALTIQRAVRDDLALVRGEGASARARAALLPRSIAHHAARAAGAVLGSRAERLPARLRGALSLEGRPGFKPVPGPR